MNEVIVGRLIPLSLQVYDGNDILKPTALVIDDLGKEHGRVELRNVGGGLYLNYSIEMPECAFCVAQYNTGDEKYEIASDVFKAVPKPIAPPKMFLGEVVSRKQDNGLVKGMVKR